MRDITLMPNDYIVTHIKTDTICEHFSNDDVVYVVEERIVPLVRCKECKHYAEHNELYINEPTTCVKHSVIGHYVVVNADDFCSYGERSDR